MALWGGAAQDLENCRVCYVTELQCNIMSGPSFLSFLTSSVCVYMSISVKNSFNTHVLFTMFPPFNNKEVMNECIV